jgi:heptaprenylglyceryl phosphate synthase
MTLQAFVPEKKTNWRGKKIPKTPRLAILIDPNKGEATERMYKALREILTVYKNQGLTQDHLEIWVGDSHEMYRGVHGYLRRLHKLDIKLPSIVIFPGHPLQISSFSDYIQMPTLLNCYRFRIKVLVKLGKKYHWISKWARRLIGRSWPIDRKYGYMVLSPVSSVGKKIHAKELTDDEAFEEISQKWRSYWEQIYLEAGSGSFGASIAGRLDLVKHVSQFAHEKNALLVTGGGIQTKEEVANLVEAGADIIVVSSVLEKSLSPKDLMLQFLEAVQNTPAIMK